MIILKLLGIFAVAFIFGVLVSDVLDLIHEWRGR